jgi:hypothetical protein
MRGDEDAIAARGFGLEEGPVGDGHDLVEGGGVGGGREAEGDAPTCC